LFYDEIFAFTIPPSCFASHLPLHKGGLSPPDSTSKRCNTLYLAGKACQKEYEQIVRTPFVFRQIKPALWKAPLRRVFFVSLLKCFRKIRIRAGVPAVFILKGYSEPACVGLIFKISACNAVFITAHNRLRRSALPHTVYTHGR